MLQNKKIWIVDDDEIYGYIINKYLLSINSNFDITIFTSGEDFIDVLNNTKSKEDFPLVILLDINMPILNGWKILDKIIDMNLNNFDDVPIYLSSSSIAQSDQEKSKSYEIVKGFLTKPINLENLNKLFANYN